MHSQGLGQTLSYINRYSRTVHVLVIGSGAREHALVVALARDPHVTHLMAAPGNPGIAEYAHCYPVDLGSPEAIATLAHAVHADLVVIGPETPLVLGAGDRLAQLGIPCFGPSQAAAQIEGSKIFAKEIMAAAAVPTSRAEYLDHLSDLDRVLDRFGPPAGEKAWVIKDDGLAAGKGVVVTTEREHAQQHATQLLTTGHRVLMESFLDGPEVSLFSIVDGTTIIPLVPAQDFKRLNDNDCGPNTGGMGAYAPLPWLPANMVDRIVDTIVRPVAQELLKRHHRFCGLLYTGLAITATGPAVIEFNCRFGDPETQSVLALLKTPLAGVLYAAATGKLATIEPLQWHPGYAVTVVLAAPGYPQHPHCGEAITGANQPGVLHAGTRFREDGTLVSAGGRVLSIVGTGVDLISARDQAYRTLNTIHLPNGQFRHDIALAACHGQISLPNPTKR